MIPLWQYEIEKITVLRIITHCELLVPSSEQPVFAP